MTLEMLVAVLIPSIVGAVVFLVRLHGAGGQLRKSLESSGHRIEPGTNAAPYALSMLLPEFLRVADWSARVKEPDFVLLATEGYPMASWRSGTPTNGRWALQKRLLGPPPKSLLDAGLSLVQGGKLLSDECAILSDSTASPEMRLILWCQSLPKAHEEWMLLCDRGTFYWFSQSHGQPCSLDEYRSVVLAVESAVRASE